MWNFNWFPEKNNNDKLWTLIVLSLFIIFLIIKAIIESGYLLFYIICWVLWVVLYFSFIWIQKKKISKPASLWKVYSKKYPIIIQYTPPKWINPAEAWLLYNCSIEPTDLTSLIYQRKFEKLIDIKTFRWEESGIEYVKLVKLHDLPLTRPLFESEIFDSIFCMWDIKIIEWAFQLRYALMLEDLEFHWIQKWWLVQKKKNKNLNIGNRKYNIWWESIMIWLFLFVYVVSIFMESLGFSADINVSITFVDVIWFSVLLICIVLWIVVLLWNGDWWWNLKFTDKWAELASKVIWYSQFIKSCDENKIKLLLKEDPLFIDRTLPYATAFWMETEFLKKISPLKSDWNAKYFKWNKIPSWVWVLRFLITDNNSWF